MRSALFPLLAAAMFVSGCAQSHHSAVPVPTVLHPGTEAIENYKVSHTNLDLILMTNVVEGKIDYLNIRKSWTTKLDQYLEQLNKTDPDQLTRNEKLAFYINLYNATLIAAVAERYTDSYTCASNNQQIFEKQLVQISGSVITLNYLKHRLIRAAFNDPRVHAALVDGSLGSPPMANYAFCGDLLDQQLDDRMRAWVTDANRIVIDDKTKSAKLPLIFKDYAADFGGEAKAIGMVGKFLSLNLSKYNVSFAESFDWTLNVAAPSRGTWVIMTQTGPLHEWDSSNSTMEVRAGQIYEVVGAVDSAHFIIEIGNRRYTVDRRTQIQPYPVPATHPAGQSN